MEAFQQDVRLALRGLRRAPGFALAAIATLAVALGVNATVFSVSNAVLLESLPYREPERLFHLQHAYPGMPAAASPPLFLDYRRESRTFEAVAASVPWNANLTGDGEAERLRGLLVSANFFSVLGADAARGRTFLAEEEQPGRERVAVVSDALWQRRFGGDPGLVGATIRLDGELYEVVGVMPPGFRWGRGWGREGRGDVWAPFALLPRRVDEGNRGNEFLDVYARLAGGVSPERAAAELAAISHGLAERFPGRYGPEIGWRVRLERLQDAMVGELAPAILLVQAAVAVLLLIAASNVAGLLLARSLSRRRETSIRAALGASRGRLLRQQLTESAVLTAVATVAGLLLATAAAALLQGVDPTLLPRARAIEVDLRVALFTAAAAGLTAAVCGTTPAWHGARIGSIDALRGTGAPARSGRGPLRLRRALVVAQTALTMALLVGAGLLVATMARLDAVDPGFARESRLALRVSLSPSRYGEPGARVAFFDRLLERVEALPGVSAAAAMSNLPLSGDSNSSSFQIEGAEEAGTAPGPHAESWTASPGYFRAMGIPLRAGRLFDRRDVAAAPDVAIVSETLVRRYFPDEDPLGERIDVGGGGAQPRWREIVGVVGDVRSRSLDQEPRAQFYTPYPQRPFQQMFVVARTDGDPGEALAGVRAAARAVDPDQPIYDATTVERMVSDANATRRTAMRALAGFATAALLLASLGLYSVLAYAVRARTAEIGVRKALGARSGNLIGLFVAQGARLLGSGLAIGAALALGSGRLLSGMLYGVPPVDPGTYAAVAVLLGAVGLAACALPAWRAARLDPARALRSE